MWYFKWLLLLVYVINSESTVYTVGANKKSHHALTTSRHRHLVHPSNVHQPDAHKLRHHGAFTTSSTEKFPKLKELRRRLESIQRLQTTTARTKTPHWKYGYGYATDEEDDQEMLDEYYDEEDGDAEEAFVEEDALVPEAHHKVAAGGDDEDDELVEEEANDEDYEDELVEEDGLRPHDIQAEESLREQSPMTQYKWENYGTRPKVEESLAKHMHAHHSRNNEHGRQSKSAINHLFHIKSYAMCRVPRPKVVNVQSIHASPGKNFRPHCTILHRCGDDTGCCEDVGKKCRPKSQEIVHLYFYSTTYSPPQTRVEKLPFYNHTECACMSEDAMPELMSPPPQRLIRSKQGHYANQNKLPNEHMSSCKCPEEFIPTVNHRFSARFGHRCNCDCPRDSEPLSGCMNMKFGMEHFSLKDRMCIVEGRCGAPTCEYGTYMKDKGRCPRKQEKMDAYGKVKVPRVHRPAYSSGEHHADDDDAAFDD